MNLHEINKPLGELDDETAAAMFLHYRRGGRIEMLLVAEGEWRLNRAPCWSPDIIYRAAAEKPSIDWSHVSEEYNFLARDADGAATLFSSKPDACSDGRWRFPRPCGRATTICGFASYKPGTCDWKDSLVCRPL